MAKFDKNDKKITGYKMVVGALGLLIGSFIMHDQYIYIEKHDILIMVDTVFQWAACVYFLIGFVMMFVSRLSRIKHNKSKSDSTSPSQVNVTGPKIAQPSTATRKPKIVHTHDARVTRQN